MKISTFNKALLNYIFKTGEGVIGEKNDSQPIEQDSLLKKINEDLKDPSIYNSISNIDLATQEFPIEFEIDLISRINDTNKDRLDSIKSITRTELIKIRKRLEECKNNVKEALLSERKLIGESYTAVLPLDKDHVTENTTVTINDGVVLGTGYFSFDNDDANILDLDTTYIGGQEETEFKIVSDKNRYPLKFQIRKNFYNNYQQIKITLPRITQVGILFIEFEKEEVFSILDKDGYEIIPKHISRQIQFPVNSNSRSFSIRLLENKDRELIVNSLYFTEQIYNATTIYESRVFGVNERLSLLSIQTCDNYTDKNVDIKYEISVNNDDYEEFRPNGKLKDNLKQTIIRASKLNLENTIILSSPVLDNGVYKFYTEEGVIINSEIKIKAFSWKLGTDFNSVETFIEPNHNLFIVSENGIPIPNVLTEPHDLTLLGEKYSGDKFFNLYFVVRKEFDIYLNDNLEFYNNKELINKEKIGDKYTFKRGVHNIKILKTLWKETVDLEKYILHSLSNNRITVIDRKSGNKIEEKFIYNPSLNEYSSLYLQVFNRNMDIYLREEVLNKKLDDSFVEYFYKDDYYPIYIISESVQILVKSIQIKATMKSLDKITCPYISNITIRGI